VSFVTLARSLISNANLTGRRKGGHRLEKKARWAPKYDTNGSIWKGKNEAFFEPIAHREEEEVSFLGWQPTVGNLWVPLQCSGPHFIGIILK